MAKPTFERDAVFDALRAVLVPYRDSFKVRDTPGHFGLVDNSVRGWSIDFAAVVAKRSAVSFYFLAGHFDPSLLAGASAELMAIRTRGEFFNFKTVDKPRIAELRKLVARAVKTWDPVAITKRR